METWKLDGLFNKFRILAHIVGDALTAITVVTINAQASSKASSPDFWYSGFKNHTNNVVTPCITRPLSIIMLIMQDLRFIVINKKISTSLAFWVLINDKRYNDKDMFSQIQVRCEWLKLNPGRHQLDRYHYDGEGCGHLFVQWMVAGTTGSDNGAPPNGPLALPLRPFVKRRFRRCQGLLCQNRFAKLALTFNNMCICYIRPCGFNLVLRMTDRTLLVGYPRYVDIRNEIPDLATISAP